MENKPTLYCSEDFLNKLILENIIEPKNHEEFRLYTKPNLKGESYTIDVVTQYKASVEVLSAKETNSSLNLEEWYQLIRSEFPTDIEKLFNRSGGRSLRTGNKNKVKSRIRKLQEAGFNLAEVVQGIQYEIWYRVKASGAENQLQYMNGMEPWLNNTENIQSMIDRSKESNEFKNHLNVKDVSKSTRKINLA